MEPSLPQHAINNKAAKVRAMLVGGFIGLVITAGFLLVIGVLLARQSVPPLTAEKLDAAIERWQAVAVRDYDCDLTLTGNRPGSVQIEVRHGQPTKLVRDGNSRTPERTWSYWTIEGLFETLERELEMADPTNKSSDITAPTGGAVLRAKFHPQYGYPEIFHRHVPGQQLDMGWQVTRFEAAKSNSAQKDGELPKRRD